MTTLVESNIEGRAEALRIAAAEGNTWRVSELLQGITEEQRETLRKLALKEIQAKFAETRASLKQPNSRLAAAEWNRLYAQWQKELPVKGEILRACRQALVGIGGQREAQSALFNTTAAAWIPEYSQDPRRMFWFQAALLLLDRPEPWTRDLLLRLVQHEERSNRVWWNSAVQLEVGKHLLALGVLPEEELLPAVSRHARAIGPAWSSEEAKATMP